MKSYLSKLLPLFLLIVLLVPLTTEANDLVKIENPLKAKDFKQLVDFIVKIIFNLALWVAPIMYVIAGFYFLTAAGDPKKVQTAKQIILYTTIGLIIVISAKGLVSLFKTIFEVRQ